MICKIAENREVYLSRNMLGIDNENKVEELEFIFKK